MKLMNLMSSIVAQGSTIKEKYVIQDVYVGVEATGFWRKWKYHK